MNQSRRPYLVVTGFGPFDGVASNPTMWLTEQLQQQASDECSSFKVLEVAAKHVEEGLTCLARQIPPGQSAVWVHFGVNCEARQFHLEVRAVNEADFRVPDQAGWQPRRQALDVDKPLGHALYSALPLQEIADGLPHDVLVSHDAGRFVCNYIYYRSLQRCQHKQRHDCHDHWFAVFVHVPPFHTIPKQSQLAFARDLLLELRACVASNHLGSNGTCTRGSRDVDIGQWENLHQTAQNRPDLKDSGPHALEPVNWVTSLLSNPWRTAGIALLGWLIWTHPNK